MAEKLKRQGYRSYIKLIIPRPILIIFNLMKQPGAILMKTPEPCHEHWDPMEAVEKGLLKKSKAPCKK